MTQQGVQQPIHTQNCMLKVWLDSVAPCLAAETTCIVTCLANGLVSHCQNTLVRHASHDLMLVMHCYSHSVKSNQDYKIFDMKQKHNFWFIFVLSFGLMKFYQ